MLNRVTGGQESQLLGTLNSNGSVFLVNPSGILIGSGAQLNAASITLNTSSSTPSDADFLNGLTAGFSTPTATGGDIAINGSITAVNDIVLASGGTVTSGIGAVFSASTVTINSFSTINISTQTPSCITCQIGSFDPPIQTGNIIVNPVNPSIPGGSLTLPSWSAFNIPPGQTTNFLQSNAPVVLNRGDGQVSNPAGIGAVSPIQLVDPSGSVAGGNTGSTSSSLTLSGQSLQSGNGGAPVITLSALLQKICQTVDKLMWLAGRYKLPLKALRK